MNVSRRWPMAAAIVAISAPALAADLGGAPRRPQAYEPAPPPRQALALEQWTGFYLGASYGYADGTTDVLGGSFDQTGGFGTLFAGYNYQTGPLVVGIEADIGGLSNFDGSIGAGLGLVGSELNYIGSVRARAGVLVSPAMLVYATGGYAYADFDLRTNGVTQSQTFDGYQVGGGMEWKFAPNWSLRAEYVYTDLSSETATFAGVTNRFDPDFHTVRAGVAFQF